MTTSEIWREVPSVPCLWASSEGRLQVRNYQHGYRGGKKGTRTSKPGFGAWDGKRYIYRLRGKTYKVARLICEAFHGPSSTDLPICLHLDENARNNRPTNLSWGTQKQNLNFPGFLTYCRSRTGDASPTKKHITTVEEANS